MLARAALDEVEQEPGDEEQHQESGEVEGRRGAEQWTGEVRLRCLFDRAPDRVVVHRAFARQSFHQANSDEN